MPRSAVCRHRCSRRGYATQRDRERRRSMSADQLQLLGFRGMSAQSLKPKYADALLKRSPGESLSIDKIKNLMTVMRRWAKKAAATESYTTRHGVSSLMDDC